MGFWDRVRDKVVGDEPIEVSMTEPTPEPEPAPTPEPDAPESDAPARAEHTVALGETLAEIASRHDATVAAISRKNDLQHPDRIYPGQVLQIP